MGCSSASQKFVQTPAKSHATGEVKQLQNSINAAPGAPADVEQVKQSINAACRARGGKYAEYSCQVVSWDDVCRGTEDGSLSCLGANITDTYLKSKDGTALFTVRSDNWNEKLGVVDSNDVAIIAGNHVSGGRPLEPTTLRDFLHNVGDYGGYAGLLLGTDLSDDKLDAKCSIRFQTTFLPVSGHRGSMEFASEAYNYNTHSDTDPRNLVILCTSQGVAVQQDGEGAKRLFHHSVDKDGSIHRYWLEAERSVHKVGGPQRETVAEKKDALARGKATSSVIGTKAMGTRFNVLMTIQVPLQQTELHESFLLNSNFTAYTCCMAECCAASASPMFSFSPLSALADTASGLRSTAGSALTAAAKVIANAARVSRGSEYDVWDGLSVMEPARNTAEHVTITVVIYNTVADGVPSEEDVLAAIDDLEALYDACRADGRLADQAFDFMKEELAAKDMHDIEVKTATQPFEQ